MVTVAIDEGPLNGPRTGIGNAVDWLLGSLADRDDTRDGGNDGGADGDDDVVLTRYLTSMRTQVTPPTRRLPIPAALAHRLWTRPYAPAMDRWLGRPDLVHGTNYVVPPTRCPRLVSVYDCWFLDHPDEASPVVARAGRVLTAAVEGGAHVVTSSHASAERVRQIFDTDRVDVVHLGPPRAAPIDARGDLDTTPARLKQLHNTSFVVSIGTLERRKNVPALVRAFARVADEHASVRLVLAGANGDDAHAVDAALHRLGDDARSRVVRLGRVDDAEKRWLLERARALAYPSLDEGFGFPILEAQMAGTPVVASSAGSIPEIAGPGALLSPPNDIDALAANLHWIVTSDRRRDELVTKGHANVSRFSWTATADAYIDLYRKVAATR